MNLQPPQPPTVPAPAIRPTPPTPPRIDKGVFSKPDTPQMTREVTTPEDMARDAVANGSGALTKRTVKHDDDEQAPPVNQTITVIPPDAPLVTDTQSDYDKGQDVLREFRDLDAREAKSSENFPAQTSTEQPRHATPTLNHQEGHSGFYWIFTLLFAVVAAAIVVKKFLFTDKPALTKSQLFEDVPSKPKATEDKVKPAELPKLAKVDKRKAATDEVKPAELPKLAKADKRKAATDKIKPVEPPPKPVKLSPKKDDDKGKHFEVRI